MTGPRPLSDGAKYGYGLIAFTITVYGTIVTAAIAIGTALVRRWRAR